MILKIIFSITVFTTVLSSINAQVHVKNSSSKPIYVALAHYSNSESYSGWVSEGWWYIIPGETKVLGNFLHGGDNTYYIHAHSSDHKTSWGNDVNLAVNSTDAFEIENCDKNYVLEDEMNTIVKFSKKTIHIGLLDEYRADVNFTD